MPTTVGHGLKPPNQKPSARLFPSLVKAKWMPGQHGYFQLCKAKVSKYFVHSFYIFPSYIQLEFLNKTL